VDRLDDIVRLAVLSVMFAEALATLSFARLACWKSFGLMRMPVGTANERARSSINIAMEK
jgi:hypothetical protein